MIEQINASAMNAFLSRVKSVAITGTTSGIGKATAELFEQEGNWAVYRIDLPFTDLSDIRHVMSYKPPVPLDAFINNAGIMPLTDFEQMTPDEWEQIIAVNMRAPFFLSQKVIPHIKDGGHLINIGSTGGIHPDDDLIAYGMSKAGVIAMTKALSKRYGDRIFVNCINPGFVNTSIALDTPQSLIDRIPMKRQAEPEEVAELIRFIVNSRYFNGSCIRFDGGLMAKYEGTRNV